MKEITCFHGDLKVGQLVRCWDFDKREGVEDRYVEGIITEINDDCQIKIHVVKDTCFPLGIRLEIVTPVETLFDWTNRIEILEENEFVIKRFQGENS